jgi:hypothetical protein
MIGSCQAIFLRYALDFPVSQNMLESPSKIERKCKRDISDSRNDFLLGFRFAAAQRIAGDNRFGVYRGGG